MYVNNDLESTLTYIMAKSKLAFRPLNGKKYKKKKTFFCFLLLLGAPVAQWVKRWPTDLAVPGSVLARAKSSQP